MENRQEYEHNIKESRGFLTGLLLGGLAGAGAMLLLAPQSGKHTRDQIQEKGTELRDQAVKTMEDTVVQVRTKANQVTTNIQKQAADIKHRGHELLDEQKEHWSPVVNAGKTAIKGD